MSYIALTRFADLHDGKHIYEAGDFYPRPGFNVSHEGNTRQERRSAQGRAQGAKEGIMRD